jgi:hypothetical protein
MQVEEVVRKVLVDEHADVLRESVAWLARQLMEVEVSELIGAERGEPTEDRATHRNGYRPRRWDTRAGEIELQIPKIRQGSYFPSFLQPRRRSEQALLSVVQQAYVCGVSTRRVDQLVESLGLRVSRSEVSRICAGLDEQVEAFRTRPLEGRYLYLFLDAKVEKVRDGGRVQRKCVVIAHGVHETGRREIIGLDVGAAETEAFWTDFEVLQARGQGRQAGQEPAQVDHRSADRSPARGPRGPSGACRGVGLRRGNARQAPSRRRGRHQRAAQDRDADPRHDLCGDARGRRRRPRGSREPGRDATPARRARAPRGGRPVREGPARPIRSRACDAVRPRAGRRAADRRAAGQAAVPRQALSMHWTLRRWYVAWIAALLPSPDCGRSPPLRSERPQGTTRERVVRPGADYCNR